MPNTLFGLYGASGFGRGVMHWVETTLPRLGHLPRIVFIDDFSETPEIDGFEVITFAEFLTQPEVVKSGACSLVNGAQRERIDQAFQQHHITQIPILGDYCTMRRRIEIGEGSLIGSYVLIDANVHIGRGFQCLSYVCIGHECVIGDYVSIAPRVTLSGCVHIEDHVYIGTGAIIKQGTPNKPLVIGRGAVVGMGAVVTKSVPPGVTVVGNPARPLVRN